jgi:hypothetical protein
LTPEQRGYAEWHYVLLGEQDFCEWRNFRALLIDARGCARMTEDEDPSLKPDNAKLADALQKLKQFKRRYREASLCLLDNLRFSGGSPQNPAEFSKSLDVIRNGEALQWGGLLLAKAALAHGGLGEEEKRQLVDAALTFDERMSRTISSPDKCEKKAALSAIMSALMIGAGASIKEKMLRKIWGVASQAALREAPTKLGSEAGKKSAAKKRGDAQRYKVAWESVARRLLNDERTQYPEHSQDRLAQEASALWKCVKPATPPHKDLVALIFKMERERELPKMQRKRR